MTEDGTCFSSPNYPNQYVNSDSCDIFVEEEAVTLNAIAFNTELDYDFLTVNSVEYSGPTTAYSPQGAVVSVGASISWRTNIERIRSGFKICAGAFPRSPVSEPRRGFGLQRKSCECNS